MQEGFIEDSLITAVRFGKETDFQVKLKKLVAAQVEAIQKAKCDNLPIIFIEYAMHGPTLDELIQAAKGARDVVHFQKIYDGIFVDKQLNPKARAPSDPNSAALRDYLREKKIDTLIMMGINGGACVQESASIAQANHFNVIAYAKGIADLPWRSDAPVSRPTPPEFVYPYHFSDDQFWNERTCPYTNCGYARQVTRLSDIFPEESEPDFQCRNLLRE